MLQTVQPDPTLQALLTLVNGAQPITKDGTPTVAGQVLQAAMPQQQQAPNMQQSRQQAGMGAQIQGMQHQKAQEQLMQMLLQQQRGGIAGAPGANAVSMAEGGIVGMAEGGAPEDYLTQFSRWDREQRRKIDEVERLYGPNQGAVTEDRIAAAYRDPNRAKLDEQGFDPRMQAQQDLMDPRTQFSSDAALAAALRAAGAQPPNVDLPSARAQQQAGGIAALPAPVTQVNPSSMPDMSGVNSRLERAEKAIEGIDTKPPSVEERIKATQEEAQVRREVLKSQGLDPDQLQRELERVDKREAERIAYYKMREAEIANNSRPLKSLTQFMLGANGFKGQGIGQVLKSGAQAMNAYDDSMRGERNMTMEARFKYQEAVDAERRALTEARHAIAMGDMARGQAKLAEAQAAKNAQLKLKAETGIKGAEIGVQQAQIQAGINNANLQSQTSMRNTDVGANAQLAVAKIQAEAREAAAGGDDKLLRAINGDPLLKKWIEEAKNPLVAMDPVRSKVLDAQIVRRLNAIKASLGIPVEAENASSAALPPGVTVKRIGN